MSADFTSLINRFFAHEPISAEDARSAFEAVLAGSWTPIQISALAVALRMAGDSPDAIVGAVDAMRAAMAPVEHGLPLVVDTCGTGGDGSNTLNLSTAAAVVVAACGLPVAKHGNRSASSRCGSADVFEALGIPLDVPIERQGALLREVGIVFLFARAHHPALKHAAQVRSELGTRTIFNVLGPLANPAHATHQLVGVYEDALRPIVARALARLGATRAWVVHSADGLDEVSPCAPTRVSEWPGSGDVREFVIAPEDFGVTRMPQSAIAGGEVEANAHAIGRILGGESHPATEAVVLNAAAALAVATGDGLRACAERARAAIESKATREHPRALEGRRATRPRFVSLLDDILSTKRVEVEELRRRPRSVATREPLDVVETLRRGRGDALRLIAEVKLRSPSAGMLSRGLTPDERALAYVEAGASMVSVLCDTKYFDGSWEHLASSRARLDARREGRGRTVPLLAKDFVVDERQIGEARDRGADAVLLIARIVDRARLVELIRAARDERIEPLVEIVDEQELESALEASARVVGVNARDLDSLQMDADRAARVLAAIPPRVVAVHLSGLRSAADVALTAGKRADAALIGEALMRENDPRSLLGTMVRAARGG